MHGRTGRAEPAGSPHSHLLNTSTPAMAGKSWMTVTALPNAKLAMTCLMGAQHFPRYTLDTKKMSERSPFWCISQPQVSLLSTCPPSAAAASPSGAHVTGHRCGDRILKGCTSGARRGIATRRNARGGTSPDTWERPGRRPMGAPPYAHAACARVSATPPRLTHTVPGKKHAVHISPTLMQCREDPDQALGQLG